MMIVRLSPNRNQDLLGAGLFLLLSWSLMGAAEFPLPVADPGLLKTAGPLLARLDEAVQEALSRNDCPGAVVLVAQNGRIAWRKAYGQRSRQPSETAMTLDTVFDLASLTKPIATATSILLLVEQGKLRLADRVAQHFPGFGRHGKDAITVEHLLLHTGGLIADNPLAEYRTGRGQALEHIQALKPLVVPGERFIYSDVGYIILGELVERLSGLPLDAFAHKTLFAPLGLTDTTFRPTGSLKERAAPTERRDNHWLIGEVHDPRAALLGGVAGHAGLFSTADDLAVFAQMLLDGGQYRGRRILAPETVQRLTKPRPVPGGQRSYGWDVRTAYSGNRGELFPSGKGFGHTGFTGTSLWIDPGSGTTVILLSHRLHPDGKGNVQRLRSQVPRWRQRLSSVPGWKTDREPRSEPASTSWCRKILPGCKGAGSAW
jgi:CubicO group peptidase (beta-lactamase class C family)